LLGIWHLILHVLALVVLALLMRNHNVIVQSNEEFEQNNFLQRPSAKRMMIILTICPQPRMVAPSTHVSLILTTNNYKKKKIECAAFENIYRVFVYT
jgi:acyl-CoA synthetase (AMP-forming)/AMP-acid ligase II